MTTETQQVVAEPKGSFQLTVNPEPVRTKQNGKWVPVSTGLHLNAQGALAPSATAYGSATISNGGNGPLVSTTSHGTTYTVSWPTPLPKPKVSGSVATYGEVFPGVDLQVAATTTGGFSEVLIVKNAAAAKNPALAKLHLATSLSGGKLAAGTADTVTVTGADENATLTAAAPMMWDSNTTVPRGKQAPLPDPADSNHAGVLSHIAKVHTNASSSSLDLTPDHQLLTASSTVFPVYIDPSFNWHYADASNPGVYPGTPDYDEVKQGPPCNDVSLFGNAGAAGDFGELGVGVNRWPDEGCPGIERAYYQWKISENLWGAIINSATVEATKVYSAACVATSVNLRWTGGIHNYTRWNHRPDDIALLDTKPVGAAYNPDFCSKATSSSVGLDVTGPIRQNTGEHDGTFTVRLSDDDDEANRGPQPGFSRFSDNPPLEIEYNFPPNTPDPSQMSVRNGNAVAACATVKPYPYVGKTIDQNPPILYANASDRDGDPLQVTYQYWVDGTSDVHTGYSADGIPSSSNATFALPPDFVAGLSNDQQVDWKAQVTDGEATSGWSPVCSYIAEPTAPPQPVVSVDDTFRTSNVGGVAKNPTGRWTFADGTGATAADSAGSHPMTLNGGSVWVKDPARGNTLAFNNVNGYAATSGPVLADTRTSYSVSAWVKLNGTDGFYTAVSQGGTNASGFYLQYSKAFNAWAFVSPSSDSANAASYPASYGDKPPVLNTWTNLIGVFDTTGGANTMTLYINGVAAKTTAKNPTPWQAGGPLSIGASKLTGGGVTNFVNGSVSDVQVYNRALTPDEIKATSTVQSTYTGTGTAADTGKFTVSGQSANSSTIAYSLDQPLATGGIPASAQITTFTGGAAATPAGQWKLSDGSGTAAADASGSNQTATLTGGASWADGGAHGKVMGLDGSPGYAATNGPVLTTSGSYSVSAWVNLASTDGFYTAVSQGGTNASGFYLQYSKAFNAWAFVSPSSDSANAASYPAARDSSPPTLNTWTNLVGVYDVITSTMSLYVNGKLAGTAPNPTPWNAPGPLTIGASKLSGGSASNFFTGQISDAQVYARALSPTEAASIYATVSIPIQPKTPGPHTLYAYAIDPAGDLSEQQAFQFQARGDANVHCGDFAACLTNTKFGNTAISGGGKVGDADGANGFLASDLTDAGWKPGQTVSVNGGTFTLPQFGSGAPDNILAANQTVDYQATAPGTGTSYLMFLATATKAQFGVPAVSPSAPQVAAAPIAPMGATVAGTYCFSGVQIAAPCAGTGSIGFDGANPQAFTLEVPDWVTGPTSMAALTLPHQSTPGGVVTTANPKIYTLAVKVPAGAKITSVTLPDIGVSPDGSGQTLHIFGMTLRNTTDAGGGQTWTGSWASPSEGQFNLQGHGYSNETFRVVVKPSLSGNTMRIKLDNALGANQLVIDNVAVAHAASTVTYSPNAVAGSPQAPKFGGKPVSASNPLLVPAGGMTYSDPLPFTVTANQNLLVTFHLSNSVPALVEHTWANTAWEYLAAGDQTTNPGGAFTSTNGAFTNVLTGLDVTTNGIGTTAVLGDGLIDAWQPNASAGSQNDVAANLTAAEPTAPTPYGTVSAGIESNEILTDNPQTFNGGAVGGPSVLSRLDRDLLSEPGLTTIVVDEGLEDLLHGQQQGPLNDAFDALLKVLTKSGITVIQFGLTPCVGYAGGGGAVNDPCTSDVEARRAGAPDTNDSHGVNDHLSGVQLARYYYIDPDSRIGVPDSDGKVALKPGVSIGDNANLSDVGYAALTMAYTGPADTWKLDDGTADPGNPLISDGADHTGPWYPQDDAGDPPPVHNGTLTGATTWANDADRGTVLQLDGSTTQVATAEPVLNTAGSFSVSAWVKFNGGDHDADIVSQDGSQNSAFALQYDADDDRWAFTMNTSDAAGSTQVKAKSSVFVTPGTWTQLTGTYNASTGALALYVNGSLAGTAQDTTPFAANGVLAIGRGLAGGTNTAFFPGQLSNVQTWSYVLTPAQVLALGKQLS
ncbi:LamG-like jellyroll fold domain-containing protein [Kutzneria sp. CA-103260]|uniref:LamG-like jellyroll fold domain-containing protein n=1 Tax=Kutzneria sp. CA-103260 TaxID=2802641 RepID=UPI001BA5404B|nr:LamG-like jellyroll fold domain-containing protein [Kutzneria sp. CA-103260]